jgi:hypothetical protein
MPNKNLAQVFLFVAFAFVVASQRAEGHDSVSPAAPPVHMVVTAEARHGAEIPVIAPNEVQVYEGREKLQVEDWIPLIGDHAGLEFFILIDDASSPSIGSQFDDIRAFIALQPETTLIGVGYMRDGTVDITQNLTADHAAAASALRLPIGNGGAFSSIYLSISDLIKRWPVAPLRREILVISDGIDQFGGSGPANPYVDTAIEDAQKAGAIVYAIYASGVGHYARSYYRAYWGQNYLSQVADETGGEAYFLGYQTAVSFAPYLQDLMRRLNHQYLLTFIPKPEKKGGLVRVKVRSEMSSVELIAASRVYVPPATDM